MKVEKKILLAVVTVLSTLAIFSILSFTSSKTIGATSSEVESGKVEYEKDDTEIEDSSTDVEKVSKAGKDAVGMDVYITPEEMGKSSHIYCVDKNVAYGYDYVVKEYISLTGRKATSYKKGGNYTSNNKGNAIMSYILRLNQGYHASNGNYSTAQKAVWSYWNNWVKYDKNDNLFADVNDWINKGNDAYDNDESAKAVLDAANEYYDDEFDGNAFTDKTENPKMYFRDNNETVYIGPFYWVYDGRISAITLKNQKGEKLDSSGVYIYDGNDFIKSNTYKTKRIYFKIDVSENRTALYNMTEFKFDLEVTNDVYGANVWTLWHGASGQSLIMAEGTTDKIITPFYLTYGITGGEVQIEKVDKYDDDIKLKGVKFTIYHTQLKAWKTDNGYTQYKSKAKEYTTKSNGRVEISNLLFGKHEIYEIDNANHGYEMLGEPKEITISDTGTKNITIKNEQKYIKISGYIWEDNVEVANKDSSAGVGDGRYGKGDKKYANEYGKNVVVTLKNTSGETIVGYKTKKALTTNTTNSNVEVKEYKFSGGYYEFYDVPIGPKGEYLKDYYIEFSYDGLIYKTVKPATTGTNTSKAQEMLSGRNRINSEYSVISGTSGREELKGEARNANNVKKHNLTYTRSNYVAKFDHTKTGTENYIIARTNNASDTPAHKYDLFEQYTTGTPEIENVNLGLRKREKPSISVDSDIVSATVSINGKSNKYQYGQRATQMEKGKEGVGVGVKFKSNYTNQYTREIYPEDVEYNPEDESEKLKVEVVYRTRLTNASTNLTMEVNELVNYYDENSTITSVKYGNKEVTRKDLGTVYNKNGYKAINITGLENVKIPSLVSGKSNYIEIFTTIELSKEQIEKCFSGNEEGFIENVTEVKSYSTYDSSGKAYGIIDYASAAGNADPAKPNTYEADTDKAPTLKLSKNGKRTLTGTVFEDKAEFDNDRTETEVNTGEIREGNGLYDTGEKSISGIHVKMVELEKVNNKWQKKKNGKVYTANTAGDGTYTIEKYIPGDYLVEYVWGAEGNITGDTTSKYTVQDYKATIYKEKGRQSNSIWYKLTNNRYSDAIDDMETRITIDENLKTINTNTNQTKNASTNETIPNQMISTTPRMDIGVEYSPTTGSSTAGGEKEIANYRIKDIDFGIIRRPKMNVTIEKKIEYIKVTLANGQILAEGNPQEDTLQGVKPIPSKTNIERINMEIDNELIHGATLEIRYALIISNNSEKDYELDQTIGKNYYHYGYDQATNGKLITQQELEKEIVKIKSAILVDYIDNELSIWEDNLESKGGRWSVFEDKNKGLLKNNTDLTKLLEEYASVAIEDGVEGATNTKGDKTIYDIGPEEKAKTTVTMKKVLANGDDLTFDNKIEIVEISKTGGGTINPQPIGGYLIEYGIGDDAPNFTITPPTGQTRNYYVIAIVSMMALSVGIIFIKKKVLRRNK